MEVTSVVVAHDATRTAVAAKSVDHEEAREEVVPANVDHEAARLVLAPARATHVDVRADETCVVAAQVAAREEETGVVVPPAAARNTTIAPDLDCGVVPVLAAPDDVPVPPVNASPARPICSPGATVVRLDPIATYEFSHVPMSVNTTDPLLPPMAAKPYRAPAVDAAEVGVV